MLFRLLHMALDDLLGRTHQLDLTVKNCSDVAMPQEGSAGILLTFFLAANKSSWDRLRTTHFKFPQDCACSSPDEIFPRGIGCWQATVT